MLTKQSFYKHNIPFTQVANEVICSKKLSFKAKGLCAYLMSKPQGWNFSADRIANESNDGRKAVLKGLKELEDVGYLYRVKMPNGRVDYHLKVTLNPKSPNGTLDIEKPKSPNGTLPKRHSAQTALISNKENTINTKDTNNKDLSTPEFFEVFWSLYPRKVAKPNALKAWRKIKPNNLLAAEIMDGLKKHKASRQWQEDNGRFIPHPATFLNQERWKDEVESKKESVLRL